MSPAIGNLRSVLKGVNSFLHSSGIVGPKVLAFPYLVIGHICYTVYAFQKETRIMKRIDEEKKKIIEERERMGLTPYRGFIYPRN